MPRSSKNRPERTGRHITIKDLSRQLGVSITTISRALNGYSDVGEATRQRVIEAARVTGYRPNRNARRLVTQRTHSLGWIKHDGEGLFADPHFVEVFAGVLRACRLRNYDVVFNAAQDGSETAVYDRYVHDKSVDGFILDLPRPNDERIAYLLETDVPFVVHGRETRQARYSWVDIDNRGIFRTLAGVLLDSGHRHIGFVNGDENYAYAFERRLGVEAALEERDLPGDRIAVVNSRHPMGLAGYQLTERILAGGKVTAIIYSSSVMAAEGHAALTRLGLQPGADIALATMDDELRYMDLSPQEGVFSLARSSLREAGGALVAELVRRCETESTPRGKIVPATFHFLPGMNTSCVPVEASGEEPAKEKAGPDGPGLEVEGGRADRVNRL